MTLDFWFYCTAEIGFKYFLPWYHLSITMFFQCHILAFNVTLVEHFIGANLLYMIYFLFSKKIKFRPFETGLQQKKIFFKFIPCCNRW